MATVYAVASSKGGVGKTTTTVNLGATLASAGLSVAVVDGDIGMANLGDALGVDPDGATLHDVLAGTADVEDAIYEGPEGVAVVPGDTSIDGFRAADPENLADVLDGLADYDYVLVDTGAGLSHDTVLPLGLADEVVLVSTTERDSLTDTEKTRQVVDRLGGTTRGVVLTSVDPDDPNAEEVAERLAADVVEAIPVDPVVRESMRRSDPLPSYAPASAAASAYRALAAGLTGESIPTPDAVEEEADEAAESATAAVAAADTDTDADAETTEGGGVDGDDAETAEAGDDDVTPDAPEDDEAADDTEAEADDAEAEADDAGADETAAEAEESTDGEELEVEDDEDAETAESEGAEATGDGETETTESEDGETIDDEDAERADDETELVDEDDAETGDADDSAGLRDDDALAADTAPSDDPLVADSADPDGDAADETEAEPVFTTSLVEEAEPEAGDDDHESSGDTDEDAGVVETEESEDEDDDKGFLGRLLG
jgi:septum site-determining protein MinD